METRYQPDGFYWFHWIFLVITTSLFYTFFCSFKTSGLGPVFIGIRYDYPGLYLVFTVFTAFLCYIIGIPVRTNERIRNWWQRNRIFQLGLFTFGIALGVLAITSLCIVRVDGRIDGMEQTSWIANPVMLLSGWMISSFCALHFLPRCVSRR